MSLRRELPQDTSFWGLFGPQDDYDYFAGARTHPFDARAARLSPVHAWWLADFALLAYLVDRPRAQGILEGAGFGGVEFFVRSSTHVVTAQSDEALIVSFRGTDDYVDVLTDFTIARTPAEGDFLVHTGFRNALNDVWPELESHIRGAREGRSLWLTGHSLGAALATLTAGRLAPAGVCTFGSPRVGDRRFSRALSVPVWRFVNNADLVPWLPPGWLYRHVGKEHFLDSDGEMQGGVDFWTRLRYSMLGARKRVARTIDRWRAGSRDGIPIAALVDHAPIHYAIRVRNWALGES